MKEIYKLATKPTPLPILNTIRVADGMAYATDVDNLAIMPTDWADGLYCAKQSKAVKRPIPSDLSLDDWPILPTDIDGVTFTLDLEALHQCNAFSSDESSRYYLQGVLVTHGEMVATDGHAMAIIPAAIPAGVKAIIHKDTIGLLPPKGTVMVTIGKNWLKLVTDGLAVVGRLVDGNYPDYTRSYPKETTQNHTMPDGWRKQAKEIIALARATKQRLPVIDLQFGRFHPRLLLKMQHDPDVILTTEHPRDAIQALCRGRRFVFMPIRA